MYGGRACGRTRHKTVVFYFPIGRCIDLILAMLAYMMFGSCVDYV